MGNNNTDGAIEPFIGPYGYIPIILRDDDTNYFTQVKMLESIYSKAWDMGFKSSLAIIPNQENNGDICVPPDIRGKGGSFYSILDNEKLIRFLDGKLIKSNKNFKDYNDDGIDDDDNFNRAYAFIEILQHGYSHSIINDRGEFGTANTANLKNARIDNLSEVGHGGIRRGSNDSNVYAGNNSWQEQRFKIELGRSIIKKAFGFDPSFFVPPYDDISYENIKLVKELGMTPIFGDSPIHTFFRSPLVPQALKKRMIDSLRQKYSHTAYIVPLKAKLNEKIDEIRLPVEPNNILQPSGKRSHQKENKNSSQLIQSRFYPSWPLLSSSSSSLSDPQAILSEFIKSSLEGRREPICILNHYHQYFYDWKPSISRSDLFRIWEYVLQFLNSLPYIWKTSFSELHERAKKISRVNLVKTGSKIVIKSLSTDAITNYSFRYKRDIVIDAIDNSSYCKVGKITIDADTKIATIENLPAQSDVIFYEK